MKLLLAAACAVAAIASPAAAQDTHAGHAMPPAAPAPAPAQPAARLNLDTPVETVMADPAGKSVLDANVPELATHEHYEAIKGMGLRQLAAYAPQKLPPELLAKVETALAAIK